MRTRARTNENDLLEADNENREYQSRARHFLYRSVEQGFFCYPYFAADPLLKVIRGEPRFAGILEKVHRRHEAFKRKIEATG